MGKWEKVKKHFKDNKRTYIASAGTGVTVAGITWAIMKSRMPNVLDGGIGPEKGAMGSFFSKTKIGNGNSFVTTIHKGIRGNPGFVTRCKETGEVFSTQEAAAKAFNIPRGILSDHLNNGRELVEGLHFERIGVLSDEAA